MRLKHKLPYGNTHYYISVGVASHLYKLIACLFNKMELSYLREKENCYLNKPISIFYSLFFSELRYAISVIIYKAKPFTYLSSVQQTILCNQAKQRRIPSFEKQKNF